MDVNNVSNFTGTDERELLGLSEIREIKLEKFKSNQIGGQELSAIFEIFKTPANSNMAAGRRVSSASFVVRLTASNGRDSSDGAPAEASDTKCLHETIERADDHWK